MPLSPIRTFYAVPGGQGDGLSRSSPGNARAMIVKAHQQATEIECRVVLLDGEYTDALHFTTLGREEHLITITADRPGGAVLLSLSTESLYDGTIEVGRGRNLVFRGLAFRQSPAPKIDGTGHFKITNRSRDVEIYDCSFVDLAVHMGCLTVEVGSSHVAVSGCHFARQWPKQGPFTPDGRPITGNHMIYISASSDLRLSRCKFHNNYGGGYVKLKKGTKRLAMFDCEFLRTNAPSPHSGPLSLRFFQINNNETPICEAIMAVRNTFINLGDEIATGVWRRVNAVPDGHFADNVGDGNVEDVNPSPGGTLLFDEDIFEDDEEVDERPSPVAIDPNDFY